MSNWIEIDFSGETPFDPFAAIETAILSIVAKLDWVSFAELPRRLEQQGFRDLAGDVCLEMAHNVILWSGFSQGLVDAILSLINGGKLHVHPASLLIYMIDGGALTLPLAKRPTAKGYRSPRWLPACLRVVPITERRAKR